MEKPRLDFCPNELSGRVVFPAIGKKMTFFSRMRGVQLIVDCLKNKKISEEEFYDFFDRISDNDDLQCENKYSETLFFVPDRSGIQGGYIQIEGYKSSTFTDTEAGRELLNVLLRYDLITQKKWRMILKEILDYFSAVIEHDKSEFPKLNLVVEAATEKAD